MLTSKSVIITSKENGNTITLDFLHVKESALILRAMNHNLRQEIMKLIDGDGKMTVTEIYVKLRLEQSVVSQHLAVLRRSNIVETKREGKFIYYAINYDRVAEINRFVEAFIA